MILKNQSGQVAIIVLIISTIVLSLGLSLSKKTTIETKIDTDEELLKKAFNAAESGIEYFLGTGNVSYSSPDNNSVSDISTSLLGNSTTIDYGEFTPAGVTQVYWLVGHNDDGTINEADKYNSDAISVCPTFIGPVGSIKVDYFYKNTSPDSYHVIRSGYNYNTSPTVVADYLDYSGVSNYCVDISTPGDIPFLVAVTPLFYGANIVVNGTSVFPAQGLEISASGKAGNPDNRVTKNIKVEKRYRLPSFLLEALTAASSVRTTP